MKVLIIGGSGLISTAIAQQLIDRGDEVALFNRGMTPVRVTGNYSTLTGDRKNTFHRFSIWFLTITRLDLKNRM